MRGGRATSCGESSCGDLEFTGGCRCDGGQPKNFLRPCLLLLLGEQAAHGYELLERLKAFGFSRDPGGLYRALRALEREGLTDSRWESSDFGPDRCLYRLTPLGREWLSAWAETLGETRRTLEVYLRRFTSLTEAEAARKAAARRVQTESPRITLDDAAAFKSIVQ